MSIAWIKNEPIDPPMDNLEKNSIQFKYNGHRFGTVNSLWFDCLLEKQNYYSKFFVYKTIFWLCQLFIMCYVCGHIHTNTFKTYARLHACMQQAPAMHPLENSKKVLSCYHISSFGFFSLLARIVDRNVRDIAIYLHYYYYFFHIKRDIKWYFLMCSAHSLPTVDFCVWSAYCHTRQKSS